MAITKDTSGSNNNGVGSTTVSVALTLSTSKLLVAVGYASRSVSSLTWNGGTENFTIVYDHVDNSGGHHVLGYLLNPTINSSSVSLQQSAAGPSMVLCVIGLAGNSMLNPVGNSFMDESVGSATSMTNAFAVGYPGSWTIEGQYNAAGQTITESNSQTKEEAQRQSGSSDGLVLASLLVASVGTQNLGYTVPSNDKLVHYGLEVVEANAFGGGDLTVFLE